MERILGDAPIKYRALKIAIGALAVPTAVAGAIGMTITASLFGSLTALALSAGAGFAASLGLLDSDRHRTWRLAAWSALIPGWLALATMFADGTLPPDMMRPLSSVLLAGGAALRIWRSRVLCRPTPPGLAIALAFTLIALAATWSGLWMPAAAMSTAAIAFGWAFELFGTGGFWLGEASEARSRYTTATDKTGLHAPAVIQMA
jgi:hypothetical protein